MTERNTWVVDVAIMTDERRLTINQTLSYTHPTPTH